MGNPAYLEEKGTSIEEWLRSVSEEDRVHNESVHGNYQRLLHGNAEEISAATYRTPNAKQRLEDYVPITLGMQEIRRIGDMPTYSSANVVDYDVPAKQAERRPLFEGLAVRDGVLVNLLEPETPVADNATPVTAPEVAPVYEPFVAPAYEPVPEPVPEESEDALPTKRTMEHRARREENVGFFASLNTKTKALLLTVAAVIVILLVAVCINTAVINSIQAGIAAKEAEIERLTEVSDGIREEITSVTNPDAIAEWAKKQGMELYMK